MKLMMDDARKTLYERFPLQKEYLGDNKPVNKVSPLVSICCITYNHAPFIKDAIEGFLMQKTNFPYEIIIGEDESSDETREICMEYANKYPNKIRLFLRDRTESHYRKKGGTVIRFNGHWVRMSARGKYIALCEGDDYWTDPLKLQKQFDFMEREKDSSFCFHAVGIKKGLSERIRIVRANKGDRKYLNQKLFAFGFTVESHTSSLFFRREHIENIPKWYFLSPVGDFPLKLLLFSQGCAYYIDEVMSVWRSNVKGSWNQRIKEDNLKRKGYYQQMITMLDGFNKYSNKRFNNQIKGKQLEYFIKSIQFDSLKKRLSVFRKSEHKNSIKYLSFRRKIVVYFTLLFAGPYRFLLLIREKIR